MVPVIAVGVVVLFGVLSMMWRAMRAGTIVERWAARNGYELIGAERRWMTSGAFWFRKAKGQEVYRVRVRIAGEERTGDLRVGGFFLGLVSDQADVVWD